MSEPTTPPFITQHFDSLPQNGQAGGGDGWISWNLLDRTRFNVAIEPLFVRREADLPDGRPTARVRMHPTRAHSNIADNVHGGVSLAFIDVAMFASAHQFGALGAGPSVTLDLSNQFVGAGRLGEPLDAVVELVRATRRLVFVRGLLVQGPGDAHVVASFSGTLKKSGA